MTTANDITEIGFTARTDAGMFALWNPSRFPEIVDYEAWEDALLDDDDIAQHIGAGELVPINIGGDGAFKFLIRTAASDQPPSLTDRENQHKLVSSQPTDISPMASHASAASNTSARPLTWPPQPWTSPPARAPSRST
jgi:hypothetical protein